MRKHRKFLLTILSLFGLTAIWYWADTKDYFKANYYDLTAEQQKAFEWQGTDSGQKLMQQLQATLF